MIPILSHAQVGYAGKFRFIGGDHGEAEGEGVRGDEEIVGADGFSFDFEVPADGPVEGIDRGFQRQDGHGLQNRVRPGGQFLGPLLRASVANLGRNDQTGADLVLARPANSGSH